jgi:periplasmic divalent cation tolerance protein
MTKFCSVYITTKEKWQAKHIARVLLEEHLIACANVTEHLCSLYWWEGKIQDEGEALLIAKTKTNLMPQIIQKVKGLHEYACPCIVCHPILEGNQEYLDWIEKETKF